MSDAFFAVQQALYDALAASTDVQALLGNPPRIYDHAPADGQFPYIVFGPLAVKAYDAIDETGFEQTLTLAIWSRYRGSKEAKDILQAVYDTLHRASLTVSGEVFIACTFAGADIAPESDGLTTRAEARFDVITQSN